MIEKIAQIKYTDSGNFFLLAGPCVVESEKLCFEVAESVMAITERLRIPFIFKASYKKANRSRLDSFTGIGDKEGLEILGKIREKLKIPTVTDIHTEPEAAMAAEY